jgi:hypothetical protein
MAFLFNVLKPTNQIMISINSVVPKEKLIYSDHSLGDELISTLNGGRIKLENPVIHLFVLMSGKTISAVNLTENAAVALINYISHLAIM